MEYTEPLDLSLPSVKMKNTNHNSEIDMPLDLSKKRTDNPHIIHTGPFSNTIINITNSRSDKRSGMHQACASSSISYINCKEPRNAHSCISVRNKYSDNYEDELESSEEPFDFSFRYSETKVSNGGQTIEHSNKSYKGKKSKTNNGGFSIYAETDLDQPTDYSLRYAENDSDSDSEVCDNEEKTTAAEFVGDTVKTYCTEGTPYETPFNFSTSTSMSDLRIGEKNAVGSIETQEEKPKIEKNTPENTMKTNISKEETAESEDHQPETSKIKSEFNSGLTSPEKPMNYCDEGTPGYFSRVSSFGSLNSAAAGSGEEKLSEEKHKFEDQNITPKCDKMQQKLPSSEVKVVKFENIVNYCEETPLMFSRSSSLGSLDSIEQHSMHDDRSSVISDFSRLTSGIISPSEIPDSPTQTVPPSPKQRKSSEFGIINRNSSIENRRHPSARRSLPTKSSIFEDDITKFKEENTPAQFSVATSLSSLTIDDNDENPEQEGPERNCRKEGCSSNQAVEPSTDHCSSQDNPNTFRNTRDNIQNRCFLLSESGQFPSNFQASSSADYNASTGYNQSSLTFPSRGLPSTLSAENTTHIYNTEDTPAVLSRNGSISELSLSTLSMLDEEPGAKRVYLSENSSELSGGHGGMLSITAQLEASGSKQQNEDVWIRRESVKNLDSTPFTGDNHLPPFQASRDECSQFAVEDSPAQFSLRSSLSHLTIESEITSCIQELPPRETLESSLNVVDNSTENTSEQNIEHPEEDKCQEQHSNIESSAASVGNPEIESSILNEESNSVVSDVNIAESVSNDNNKSFEIKSDDSRYNSMKKRKWKWKWQFGSEDSHQSESGGSTPTDRQSCSNNEEFDQGRRNRVDKNHSGSLDTSFRKKKWWKWKFGSKEKDSSGTTQNVPEAIQNCFADDDHTLKSNSMDEKELDLKEETTVDTRNKSKRWKWKWRLNFKDDDNSKAEKISPGLSKSKHHVNPENAKEPLCITELSQYSEVSKEISTVIKLSSEDHSKLQSELDGKFKVIAHLKLSDAEVPKNNLPERIAVPVRRKLDTPEASDSEQSVIIEEINDYNLYANTSTINNSKLNDSCHMPNSTNESDNIGQTNNSNYAALVEECIQLGMPKKIPDKTTSQNDSSGLRRIIKLSEPEPKSNYKKRECNVLCRNTPADSMVILEECIQLGIQKKSQDSSVNKFIEDSVSSPKTNYKTVNQKVSTSSFPTNKSLDVTSVNAFKTQGIRNTTEQYSSEKLTRARSTNFDSSSLNRLSVGRSQRNDFNSNDNILRSIPNEKAGKVEQLNIKKSLCIENYNGKNAATNSSKISEQELSNSQFRFESSCNRTTPKNLGSKSSSSRGDTFSQTPTENNSQVFSENVRKVPLRSEKTTKSGSAPNFDKNPDFAALIEECIQLGMPKRKESSEETLSPTLSPSLVNKKPITAKGWPEYLSRVSCDNKSASLPKKSTTYLTTPHSNCASNEDFTSSDSHSKKNFVIQNTLEKNPTSRILTTNGPNSDMLKNKQDNRMRMPSKMRYDTMKEFDVPQRNETSEESLYANADETKSYLNSEGRQIQSYSFKSPSPKMSLIAHHESTYKKGISSDEENNATLIEDCIRLGVPVKKLHELRRSLDKNKVKETINSEGGKELVRSGSPRIGDFEDGAVYANTTERYSTFRNSSRSEYSDTNSSIFSETKFVPYLATNKISNNNPVNNDPKKKSARTDSKNNQDFAAIIEECIQLGMPKRKEFSRETLNSNSSLASINSRSNSVTRCTDDLPKVPFEFNRSATLPKGSTYPSSSQNCYSSSEDFRRLGSLKKKGFIIRNTPPEVRKSSTQDQLNVSKTDPVGVLRASPQNRLLAQQNTSPVSPKLQPAETVPRINRNMQKCVGLDEPKQEEEPEESLYVNVSKHAAYSRSTRRQQIPDEFKSPTAEITQSQEDPNKRDINGGEPNYSALVEECIKLGMPTKNICDVQKYLNNITSVCPKQNPAGKLEPLNDSDSEDMAIYANTSERYSTFKSSLPESALNRSSRIMTTANFKPIASSIQLGDVKNREVNTVSSNTIEKALEECIQLGWPKKKETDKNFPSKTSNMPLNDIFMEKVVKPTSKNANAASVARNMQNQHLACSQVPTMVTGAREDSELQSVSMTKSDKEETQTNMERNGFNRTNLTYSSISNNESFGSTDDNHQEESEISFAGLADIDVKLLDPQVMLESLEKYTEKLISEAELRLNSKK